MLPEVRPVARRHVGRELDDGDPAPAERGGETEAELAVEEVVVVAESEPGEDLLGALGVVVGFDVALRLEEGDEQGDVGGGGEAFELAVARDDGAVEQLSPNRSDPALGEYVRYWSADGVRRISRPSVRKSSSELSVNWLPRSRTRARLPSRCSARLTLAWSR